MADQLHRGRRRRARARNPAAPAAEPVAAPADAGGRGRGVSQAKSGDLASQLVGLAMECVQEYRKSNNDALPAVIIIFRDGVGDGQIGQVLSIEVAEIKEALEPMYAPTGKALRMAFIVVTKRINTRIFLGENNPPPGTVVDSTIRYDFFLISQSVRHGTVTPTHYNVIEDSSLLKPNHIQRLTYKFTHLYFNWSGTVRVPAPCQYAHKLAKLTAQNIMQPHSNLDRLLYFL